MMDRMWFSTAEAARILGFKNPQTLRKYRVLGIGPRFTYHGQRAKYLEADLRDWATNRETFSSTMSAGKTVPAKAKSGSPCIARKAPTEKSYGVKRAEWAVTAARSMWERWELNSRPDARTEWELKLAATLIALVAAIEDGAPSR